MRVVSDAFKVELDPTPEQITLFLQHCGQARYVYNWALGQRREWWDRNRDLPKAERTEEPTGDRLSLRWTKEHPEWSSTLMRNSVTYALKAVTLMRNSVTYALKAVDLAFANFFRRVKAGTPPFGYPRFKKRGECPDAFTIQVQEEFWPSCQARQFRLGKIGMVKSKEFLLPEPKTGRPNPKHGPRGYLRGIVNRIVVSRHADRWYASIMVTRTLPIPTPIVGPTVGIDMGISHVVTASDGRQFAPSDHLERQLKRLRRLQRKQDRQRKAKPVKDAPDSGEYRKQSMRVAKLHKHVADSRARHLHNTTAELVKTASTIVTEDFNVQDLGSKHGPTRGKHNATQRRRRIMTAGMGEIRRQLDYKTQRAGTTHMSVGGATDQTCSECGSVNEQMKDQQGSAFDCTACGHHSTRQANTARLLELIGRGDPPRRREAAE